MAKGNEIVVSGNPKGVFLEGTVDGTPKPGVVMQINAAVEPVGGRHDWTEYDTASSGDQRLVAVLLPDSLQGKAADAAYVDGDRCFLYCPVAGEELNMLADDDGTPAFAIGDVLILKDTVGKVIATTGTPESEPFIVLETKSAISADTLIHCIYTGH